MSAWPGRRKHSSHYGNDPDEISRLKSQDESRIRARRASSSWDHHSLEQGIRQAKWEAEGAEVEHGVPPNAIRVQREVKWTESEKL